MIVINNLLEVMNNIDDVKVVIFDLDDTLYNEIDYMVSGFRYIIEYLKCKYSINLDINGATNLMIKYYNNGDKPIDRILIDNNIYTEANLNKCIDIYRNQKPNIVLDDKIRNMLFSIKNMEKKLGIITDGRPNSQNAKIDALNIRDNFNKIIITDELGNIKCRKPNKISYEMMKDYFKVEYKDMCYIGDNINKDFIYPETVGMKAIFFNNEKSIHKN